MMCLWTASRHIKIVEVDRIYRFPTIEYDTTEDFFLGSHNEWVTRMDQPR